MRTIRVNGVKCDVSKSEAEFVNNLYMAGDKKLAVTAWVRDAPTEEAGDRRVKVASALFGDWKTAA